jgi:acyl-coenzyme A synthetase/AMP-(fatty) acid ligase
MIAIESVAEQLPLVAHHRPGSPLSWHDGQPVSWEMLTAEAQALAARLPQHAYALNLCNDRHYFTVAFAAALLRGQTSLLPPNRSVEVIREIAREYTDSYMLHDQSEAGQGELPPEIPALRIDGIRPAAKPVTQSPLIPAHQVAALVFTSGSTGHAQANVKTWASLVRSNQLAMKRFFPDQRRCNLVVTVPPQHMYGLETSVLMPLGGGLAVHSGRPFYPEDVRLALESVPAPRVLITTPVHLRACVRAGIRPPPVEFLISATAALPITLAQEAEALFNAPVLEIYGCTEAGSLASRRTVEGEAWTLYEGMRLDVSDAGALLSGPQLAGKVMLQDVIEKLSEDRFALRGRSTDMVNIAGKRASLGDLNYRLNAIEGVHDGVIFLPDGADEHTETPRLAALVVAPGLKREQLLAALRQCMDPIFLPRPLYWVEQLPRNETTKLPREALMQLFRAEQARHS